MYSGALAVISGVLRVISDVFVKLTLIGLNGGMFTFSTNDIVRFNHGYLHKKSVCRCENYFENIVINFEMTLEREMLRFYECSCVTTTPNKRCKLPKLSYKEIRKTVPLYSRK